MIVIVEEVGEVMMVASCAVEAWLRRVWEMGRWGGKGD